MKNIVLLVFMVITRISVSQNSPCFYQASINTFSTGNGPNGIAKGDFNKDGYIDLAVSNYVNAFYVLLGNSLGTFSTGSFYSISNTNGKSIATADFDNDTNLDIVVSIGDYGSGPHGVSIFKGVGDGTFNNVPFSNVGCMSPELVVVADLNNDNIQDIVSASKCSPTLYYYLLGANLSIANLGGLFTPQGNICRSITINDFNGDGFKDIAAIHKNTNSLTVFSGGSTPSYTSYAQYACGGVSPRSITKGDVNNDGFVDLMVVNESSSNYAILLGSASGTFAPPISTTLNAIPVNINLDDYDMDGNLDASITFSAPANYIQLLKGNGNGLFSLAQQLNVGTNPVFTLSEDVNNDGLKDLVAANYGSNTIKVWLNGYVNPSVSSSNSITCAGSPVVLTATGASNYLWSMNATTSTISVSPNITTTYSVSAYNGIGCSKTASYTQQVSICTNLNTISTDEVLVIVYPNPSSTFLNLQVLNSDYSELQVYNTLGEIIYETILTKSSTKLDVSDWKNGLYQFTLKNKNGTVFSKKVIKYN